MCFIYFSVFLYVKLHFRNPDKCGSNNSPQEQPRFMLPTNEEGDQLSSEVNSDTDLGEDDLSETEDENDWETNC